MPTSSPTSMDHEAEPSDECNKRKDPDSRTVVIASEKKKKKQRTELHMLYLNSMWWMMQRPRGVQLPVHEIWYEQEIIWMRKKQLSVNEQAPQRFMFHWPCRTSAHMMVYLQTGEIYLLTEEQLLHHWDAFEASDKAELKQLIDEKLFKKLRLSDPPKEVVLVDGTWVRKLKRNPDNSLKAKSRLCARGFSQKQELPTRSTTASRLSQRLVLSTAATHRLKGRSWDVSGAFLKGFSFEKVKEELGRRGISSKSCAHFTSKLLAPLCHLRQTVCLKP